MDTNEMIALLLPPNGCFACSDTRKEIAEELARRSVDLERECADADKICAALGLTVDKSRTEGGSLNVPRIVGHIQETLTALRESHAFGVAMSDKYVASRAPECAAAQKPVAWATPSLLVTLSAVEKNHLTNPDRRKRGGEVESIAQDAERYSVPLYTAPPAQAEPQEGDLLHTMMEWARTEEGRKQLADSYRPHLWACAKRVADPQNEAATCRHWCGDIEHCQPIASAPAQPEPIVWQLVTSRGDKETWIRLTPPIDDVEQYRPLYALPTAQPERHPCGHLAVAAECVVCAQPAPAEDAPVAYMCPDADGCGCLWRENRNGTMSLYNGNQKSCAACEPMPLAKLTPLVPAARLAALREDNARLQDRWDGCTRLYESQRDRANKAESALAEAQALLERCRTILGNMAQENQGAIFNRWPISHEPLRNDARGILPELDAAIDAARSGGKG